MTYCTFLFTLMNNQHFEQYLAQIRQTDAILDLPKITIHIHILC